MARAYTVIIGVLVFFTSLLLRADAKVFTHCELAQELRRLQIPESQIPTWVCIAHYESRLNSSATSGTGDHGIFQISEEYWCSPPGRGKGCGLSCASFEDDDITDDIGCIQTIFDEHKDLSGNGFTAWAVYPRCKSSSANRFIKKCSFGSDTSDNAIDTPALPAVPPLDLRFSGYPSYSTRSSSTNRQDPTYYTKSNVYTPRQDLTYTRAPEHTSSYYSSLAHLSSAYPSEQNPNREYTYSNTPSSLYSFRNVFSSTAPPPPQIFLFSPSKSFTTARPSSYSIGSIYSNSRSSYFDGESSTSGPSKVYSYTPSQNFRPNAGSRFNSGFVDYTKQTSSPVSQQYTSYSRPASATIETSSPAPPLYKFKAPWADFPWWNGGKKAAQG